MFDETFFKTSLPKHIEAKGTESTDQLSVRVTLRNGQTYKIGRILEVSPQWVMCEVSPPDGKPPRQHSAQAQQAGAPLYDLDRVAIAYEYIVSVMVTLEPQARSGISRLTDAWRHDAEDGQRPWAGLGGLARPCRRGRSAGDHASMRVPDRVPTSGAGRVPVSCG